MTPSRSDNERLQDIPDAIAAIARHPLADRAAFDAKILAERQNH